MIVIDASGVVNYDCNHVYSAGHDCNHVYRMGHWLYGWEASFLYCGFRSGSGTDPYEPFMVNLLIFSER